MADAFDLFNEDTLALMSRVLNDAWTEAQSSYAGSLEDRSFIRAAMAQKIIEAIEAGETDAENLKRAALSLLDTDWRRLAEDQS